MTLWPRSRDFLNKKQKKAKTEEKLINLTTLRTSLQKIYHKKCNKTRHKLVGEVCINGLVS